MSTARTKVFMNNRSQAVRLPKSVALPDGVKDVVIVAIDNRRIITPAGESWDDWFDHGGVSDDFMRVREQPQDQNREPIE